MHRLGMVTEKMALEKLSDENMVWFYREELRKVDLGMSITLIPKLIRRRMIRLGILECRRGLDKASGFILSPGGRKILDDYENAHALEGEEKVCC